MALVVRPSSLEEVTLPSKLRKGTNEELDKKAATEAGVQVLACGLQPDQWLLKAGCLPAYEKPAEDNIATLKVGKRVITIQKG